MKPKRSKSRSKPRPKPRTRARAKPRPKARAKPRPARRRTASRKLHVVVVGAGAFGGWTALNLLRRRVRVTLLDAWGPGHSRASSGGESRVIRATYGPDQVYTEMAVRSLEIWRASQAKWKRRLFHQTGVLWLASPEDRYERAAVPLLREARVSFEQLTPREASRRFPQISFDGINWAIFEKNGGYLAARRACEAVQNAFLAEGGEYRHLSVRPGPMTGGEMKPVTLSNGASLQADHYVFACGPWLAKLFPDLLSESFSVTRQEVFFFGIPPGDPRFQEGGLPVWIDHGPRFWYGVPGNEWRGFKVADDSPGPAFDPTFGDRIPSIEGIRSAREYLHFRFPALRGVPLVEARVCQYENTRDHHFILDRHPRAANAWLIGGGSGHGFKHGPAVGERVAEMILGKRPIDPFFGLARFGQPEAL